MARKPKIAETFSASDLIGPPASVAAKALADAKPEDQSPPEQDREENSGPAADPDPVVSAQIVAVVIAARQAMRRRAGRFFTPEPVRIPVAELTDDDLLALAGDPMLEFRTELGAATEALTHVQV